MLGLYGTITAALCIAVYHMSVRQEEEKNLSGKLYLSAGIIIFVMGWLAEL